MTKTGAEPLYLKGNKTGLLFLHGFTASPYELKQFALKIHQLEGYTVSVPLLAGHGESNETLNLTGNQEFIQSAHKAFIQIQAECDRLYLIGMSMGGSLCLEIASTENIAGLVLMGTPLYLPKKTILLPFVLLFKQYLNKTGGPDIRDSEAASKVIGNDKIPLKALYEFKKMLRLIRKKLHLIKCPILIMHSLQDHTISFKNAKLIQKRISSVDKTFIKLNNSYHILSLDYEKDLVFDHIQKFVRRLQAKE